MKKTLKVLAAFRWIAIIAVIVAVCAACITPGGADGDGAQTFTDTEKGGGRTTAKAGAKAGTEYAADAGTQAKYALVIGNSNYIALGKLRNPVNDAEDMAATLADLGFNVDKVLDCDLNTMESAVMRLKNRLSVSKNTYGFFFYAGHGVQSNGVNFLIPVSANIPSEGFLRERALSVQAVLNELNDASNELNVVVLDACRDNPFNWGRNSNRGLTVIANQPADSIVVYATSAGSIAQDGMGRNGLFTTSLLNNLKTPGLEVTEIFRRTGQEVIIASDRKQIPAVYSQYFGNAYFSKALAPKPFETPQTAPSAAPMAAIVPSQPPETLQLQPLAMPFASSVYVNPSSSAVTGNKGEDGAGITFTSVSDFKEWLLSQTDNTASTPYNAKLNLKSLTGIKTVLNNAPQKYVNLDLSGSTFTSIEDGAFEDCDSLASIIIPVGVTGIGVRAFAKCNNLFSVLMPNSVKNIADEAFQSCTELASIIIPASVTSIRASVFSRCVRLASVIIESGVANIENYAFYNCISLASITMPDSIISMQNNAFNSCNSLSSVTFQGTIPSNGFSNLIINPVFPGDLRAKFYATDKTNGTPGTYTRKSGSSIWTRQ